METTKKTVKTSAPKTATKKVASTSATKKVASPKTTTKTATKQPVKTEKVVNKVATAPKEAKPATKKIKVTLVKSKFGYNKSQLVVVRTLGLNKIDSSNILPDNPATRGMVRKVCHLVKVEELD